MALQHQNVPVQFRGLETKLDPRHAVIGDVVILENVRYDAPPKWQKRFGYDRLGQTRKSSSASTEGYAGSQLAVFRDELLVNSGQELFSDGKTSVGAAEAINVASKPVRGSAFGMGAVCSAIHTASGVALHTWTEDVAGGGQRRSFVVMDHATGRVLRDGTYPNFYTTGCPSRTLVVGSKIVAIGATLAVGSAVNGLTCWVFDSAAPTAAPTDFVITAGDVITNVLGEAPWAIFDAFTDGTLVYVVYVTAAGIVTRSFNPATASVSAASTVVAGVSPRALTCFDELSYPAHFWVAYATATAVRAALVTKATLAVFAANTLVETVSGVVNVSGASWSYPGFVNVIAAIAYEVGATSPSDHRVHVAYVVDNNNGTIANFGATCSLRGVGLASKVFYKGPWAYALVAHESTLQSTYFLCRLTATWTVSPSAVGSVVAKVAAGTGGGLVPALPEAVSGIGGAVCYGVPILQSERVGVVGGSVFAQVGLRFAEFSFDQKPSSYATNEALLLTGGFLSLYDGVAVAEHGFHLYPEGLTVTPSGGAPVVGPTLSPVVFNPDPIESLIGTYYYRVVAVFADGHESLASNEGVVTLTSLGNAQLTWTAVGGASSYRIYRGTESGVYSVFFNLIGATTVFDTGGLYYQANLGNARPNTGSYETATFQVCATYEWVDAQGVVHQSAPSPAVEVVAPPVSVGGAFDYVVPTLRLTSKRTPVAVVIWRTLGNQSVFYRVTPPPAFNYAGSSAWPIYNDVALDSVSYAGEKIPDDVLSGNAQLVFNPLNSLAEVAPLPCDAPLFITRYRNRAIVIPAENPAQILFSKEIQPGSPIEFNPQQFYQSVVGAAALVGAIEMDDKLILFSEDRIYFMAGGGPAPNGTGSDFTNPYRIPSDVGCVNARSLVLTPQGVLFQSWKGIYLLGRDLSVQYFGSAVEAYGTVPITSANTLPDCQRVVLTLSSGVALVYDSFVQKWAVWTNYNAADALVYQGKFTHVRPDGSLNRENNTRFTDQEAASNSAILIKFTTTWLAFAGLNGFQRVWRLMIRGDYKSPHSLKVDVAFDDDPTVVQTITFDTAAYFGAASFKPYEFQVKLLKQKCSSLQVTVTETEPAGQEGEGFALSGLTFLAGLLPGLHKVPVGRTIS